MELGHLLTHFGLTYPEVCSNFYHDSFCQLGSSVSLPWVFYFEAFYLHTVSIFSCISVIRQKLVLFFNSYNYSLSYPTVILTFSWYTLFSQTRKWRPSHSSITVSPGMQEMPSLNMPVQRLKVATLPLDLPCSGPVTHSGEILTTGKSHGKKPDRFSLNDNMVIIIIIIIIIIIWKPASFTPN